MTKKSIWKIVHGVCTFSENRGKSKTEGNASLPQRDGRPCRDVGFAYTSKNSVVHYASVSQPFFNRGTLSWNRSPDGTLHLWLLFYIQDLHIITFFLLHNKEVY